MVRRPLAGGLHGRTRRPRRRAARGRGRGTGPALAGGAGTAEHGAGDQRAAPGPCLARGDAVAAACRLGLADDPRVKTLARSLVEWQWPDGGWNCDRRATGRRSSFHESFIPAWGLGEYAAATGADWAARAARRTAELFLSHSVYKRLSDGQVINRQWTVLHYPPYWHYDVLAALLVLSRLGFGTDPRTNAALDLLESKRLVDGRWQCGAYRWKAPDGTGSGPSEVVDWGRGGPNEMLTLNALRVLRAAGRL